MLLQDTASADPLTSYASFPSFPHSQPLLHQRPDLLPAQHPQQHARLAHVEDAQRQVAVAGQGEGGGVHHVEVAGDDLVVAQRVEALGVGVLLGVQSYTPSTLVALSSRSAPISIARRAAPESVVKNGLPVPAAKIAMRPFSRCRMARRRM